MHDAKARRICEQCADEGLDQAIVRAMNTQFTIIIYIIYILSGCSCC
jgi:hypothetical protein